MRYPESPVDRTASHRRNRQIVDAALPIIVLVLLLLLGFATIQPFLPAILWGIFLSVSLQPLFEKLVTRLGERRGLAAVIIGLLLTIVLLLPVFALSRALIAFIPDAITWFSEAGAPMLAPGNQVEIERNLWTGEIRSIWRALLRDLQFIREHFGEELRPAAFWMIREGRLVGAFVAEFALGVLLATILLHRSRTVSGAFIGALERVGGSFATNLGNRAVVTIRTTVLGLLGSAAAQTAMASVAFYLSGVPHWPILAMLTFMLGLIQVGPVFVWLPISIWLWTTNEVGMAIFVSLWGLIVVGLTDNIVKSLVMARGADVPAILAFLGAVGGMLAWGVVGIFLGPVILAICYQLTLQWLENSAAEVDVQNTKQTEENRAED